MGQTEDDEVTVEDEVTTEELIAEWERSADTQIEKALREGVLREGIEFEEWCLEFMRLTDLSDQEIFARARQLGVDLNRVRGSC